MNKRNCTCRMRNGKRMCRLREWELARMNADNDESEKIAAVAISEIRAAYICRYEDEDADEDYMSFGLY